MAFSITDLKKGAVFEYNEEPYRVVEYAQKVMGRGGSIVSIKMKSLMDGKVLDKTFKGNEQIKEAEVILVNVQYLYSDSSKYYFMDESTFEQYVVENEVVGDSKNYLKEGDQVTLQLYDNKPINLVLPKNLPLQITYTENAVKGDTSTSINKEATLETGFKIKVPAFIKTGDVVSVDTASGQYRERIRK